MTALCLLAPALIRAQDAPIFHSRDDFFRCLDRGAPGPFSGASAGLFGYGLSCNDEARISYHLFTFVGDPRYQHFYPYQGDGVRIVWLASGKDSADPRRANYCRLFHVEYVALDGAMRALRTTLCYVHGRWVLPGVPPGVPVIVRETQTNPNPALRVPMAPTMVPGGAPRPFGPYRLDPDREEGFGPPDEGFMDGRDSLGPPRSFRIR